MAVAGSWVKRLRLRPYVDGKLAAREDAVAARPILQQYGASTVYGMAMHPAEFENLASRITLWKSQKCVGRKRLLAKGMGFEIATVSTRPILQEYDAFHS